MDPLFYLRIAARAKRLAGRRLIAYVDSLDAVALDDTVAMERAEGRVQGELRGHAVAHRLAHRVHHRAEVQTSASRARLAGSWKG